MQPSSLPSTPPGGPPESIRPDRKLSEGMPDVRQPEVKRAAEPVAGTVTAPVASASVAPSAVVVPSQGAQPASQAAAPPAQANLPAEDVDVIEKEWVERAENIIKADANDPYKEEKDEESLSREYLKQRFNVDVDNS